MIDYNAYQISHDSILVLELTGKLDDASSEFLLDYVQGRLEEGNRKFIFDCSQLEYISSSGLGTLVRAHSRMKKAGGDFALTTVPGVIAELLRIVHFDRIFHIFPTISDATQALNAPPG